MWIGELISALRGNAASFKALTSELHALKDEYKQRMKDAESRVTELEKMVEESHEYERDCQMRLITTNARVRDLEEQMIFLTKGKS